MDKKVKLSILCSVLLTGCIVNRPVYISSNAMVPRSNTPPIFNPQSTHAYSGSVTKDQMQVAVENAIQSLDDNYELSPVTLRKLETLFGVDLLDAKAQHSNDRRLWQTLTNDGLYFVTVNYSDKPEGLKLVLIDWKDLQTEDHRLASIQHIPANTAHCLTLADISGYLDAHGWHIVPTMPQTSWPAYAHSNDPNAVQIQFGGSIYNPNNFGPCINQLALKKLPNKKAS